MTARAGTLELGVFARTFARTAPGEDDVPRVRAFLARHAADAGWVR